MKPKIIFDFENNDLKSVQNLYRHIGNLLNYYSRECTIEVMAYGPGLNIILKNSNSIDEVLKLQAEGTTFVACQNTMKRMDINEEQLLTGVIQVKSGLAHIVDRQLEGWAYLKA